MIEYLYNAVRATAGEPIEIMAIVTAEDGTAITKGCKLKFYTTGEVTTVEGVFINDQWSFTISAEVTKGKSGRFWYSIEANGKSLCFMTPIYLVGSDEKCR